MFFPIAIFAHLVLTVLSECEPHSRYRSTDLAIDESVYDLSFFNKSYIADCGCDGKYTCIRKCCDEDYVFDDEQCVFNNSIKMSIPIFHYGNLILDQQQMANFRFVSGVNECLLDEDEDDSYTVGMDEFYIQKDGRLWLPALSTYFELEHYCIEYDEDLGPSAVLCVLQYDTQALDISNRITIIGMCISLPFLFVTFLVYAILPLRNLHGKALMCYIFSLFFTYLMMIVTDQDAEGHSSIICALTVMTFYFFFEASFLWMNVMCIDIYLTFSGPKVLEVSRKRIERRRFILYSIYSWSVPMILVILVQTFSRIFKPNRWYNPGVTDQDCWLNDGIPTFIYLYLPMTIVIIANLVLFGITAYKIRQVQKDTAVLRKGESAKSTDDNLRFGVYFKLFLVMGVNWSMEVIAWAVNWQFEKVPPSVWYFTDFCNAAFGLVVFVIFVCNKKVWKLLKLKYYKLTGKQVLDSSSTDQVTMRETTVR